MPVVMLTPEQAAEYLGMARQTMARWRVEGRGPRFVRCGARVRYTRDDLDTWVARQTRRSTADAGPVVAA